LGRTQFWPDRRPRARIGPDFHRSLTLLPSTRLGERLPNAVPALSPSRGIAPGDLFPYDQSLTCARCSERGLLERTGGGWFCGCCAASWPDDGGKDLTGEENAPYSGQPLWGAIACGFCGARLTPKPRGRGLRYCGDGCRARARGARRGEILRELTAARTTAAALVLELMGNDEGSQQ
jgi:hypothetical protein